MDITIKALIGQTLTGVHVLEEKTRLLFECADGRKFELWHDQSCCESVEIEEVIGDLQDLVGSPVLLAEEASSEDRAIAGAMQRGAEVGVLNGMLVERILSGPGPGRDESETWTFYRIGTARGVVTLRWYGTSNGCYSERVDFREVS